MRNGSFKDVTFMSANVAAEKAAPQVEMNKFTPPVIRKDGDGVTDSAAVAYSWSFGQSNNSQSNNAPVQIRKNLNETAFFFPDLKTDAEGNIEFSFTTPEALTKWKLQTFTHTKELAFGLSQKELVTQKDLMVQPNMLPFMSSRKARPLPVRSRDLV